MLYVQNTIDQEAILNIPCIGHAIFYGDLCVI